MQHDGYYEEAENVYYDDVLFPSSGLQRTLWDDGRLLETTEYRVTSYEPCTLKARDFTLNSYGIEPPPLEPPKKKPSIYFWTFVISVILLLGTILWRARLHRSS